MRSVSIALLHLIVLSSCTGSSDTGSDDSGATPLACTTTVDSTFPQAGATDAYAFGSVEVSLTDHNEDVAIQLSGPDGEIAGTTSWRGETTLVFTPSEGLSPDTDYVATIDVCDHSVPVDFHTSLLGTPTNVDVTGRAYLLDLSPARVLQPAGVGDIIKDYLTSEMLVGFSELSPEVKIIGAVAEEGTAGNTIQAACSPTVDFPSAAFSPDPYFEASSTKLDFVVAKTHIVIHDLYLSGTFTSDGELIEEAVLAGLIDTRPLAGLIADDATEDAGCELADSLGAACEPCPDGEVFCLRLHADHLRAAWKEGVELYRIEDECELSWCANDVDCVEE